MMPPMCKFCQAKFRHDPRSGRLLRFAISDADKQRNADMAKAGKTGHPRGAHWFCKDHYERAQELTHLHIGEALEQMQSGADVSKPPKPLGEFRPPDLPPGIQKAGPADTARLAKITADAFRSDPVNRWIFQSFDGMHSAFSRLARHVYVPRGMCHMIDGKAASMWMLPGGSNDLPLPSMAALCFTSARRGGMGAISRMLAFDAQARKAHPKSPHLYLFTVGVRPEFKGQGYGKMILSPVLKAADASGLPVYLENSKPENRGFYRSLGFERQEIFHPKPGAPPVEAMQREPQP